MACRFEPRCGKLLDAVPPDYFAGLVLIGIIAISPAPLGKPVQEQPHPIDVSRVKRLLKERFRISQSNGSFFVLSRAKGSAPLGAQRSFAA